MTPLKIKKTVIQAKIEATYGTYIAPAAKHVVFAENISITPLQGNRITDDVECGKLGSKPTVLVGEHIALSFDFAFRGAGTAGDLPSYDTIMRGGGRARVQTVGTEVVYSLIDDNQESMSLSVFYDGNQHKIAGCRGVVTHSGNNGDKAMFHFEGLGLYMPVVAGVAPNIDCSAIKTAPPLVIDSRSAFSFFGQTPPLESWGCDYGSSAIYEETINAKEVRNDDRSMTANLQFKANKVDEHDYFAGVRSSAVGASTLTIGNVSGHIVEIRWPEFELTDISYTERNAHYDYAISGGLLPGAGNLDEIIVVK